MMFKQKILVLLVLTAVAVFAYALYGMFIYRPPLIADIFIGDREYYAYLALTSEQQMNGLMNVTSIGDCYGHGKCIGMLFVFQKGSSPCFWMKNTVIPLKQYWISNETITHVAVGVPYSTNQTCYYGDMVLETNASSNFSIGEKFLVNESIS
jgi:uncharacterized membrane protein (UPF0127 family)